MRECLVNIIFNEGRRARAYNYRGGRHLQPRPQRLIPGGAAETGPPDIIIAGEYFYEVPNAGQGALYTHIGPPHNGRVVVLMVQLKARQF